MASEEYIDVEFDIFEYTGQRARVKKSLTVNSLIEEILREFDDIPSDFSNKYVLYLKGEEKPLDSNKTMLELDIQPQDELVFDRYRSLLRRELPPTIKASFVEEKTLDAFELQWYPAIIGRSSTDMDHNFSLAVNVENLPDGKTISRRHALISFAEGKFFVEPQSEYNPVYLNGVEIPYQQKFLIKDNDRIMLGFNRITLIFKQRKLSESQQTSRPVTARQQTVEERPAEPATQIDGFIDPKTPPAPRLIVETAANKDIIGTVLPLEEYPFLMGRTHPLLTGENDMSRAHAEISYDEQANKHFIVDLNSTNGVEINGKKIEANIPYEITPGCYIRLGFKVIVRFEV
ncbi:MAG TPA: FHA domain-containing protein [Chloroflexi bacterium]|nr:FHA domain-containing protein [Chloroflexota bacterium]